MDDLVSIIVPVYNTQGYLDRCLESLVKQTYKNIEIIAVDDGSTDSSFSMLDDWALKDSRIVVFHKENGGLSDARNFGLAKANGKYVSLIDSDDYVDPTFIEFLYKLIIENNAEISAVGFQEFTDTKLPQVVISNETEVFTPEQAIESIFSSRKFESAATNKLYLKELFNGISYPVGKVMEDAGVTHLLFDKCKQIVFNPSSLYFYYQREGSIMHKMNKKAYADYYTLIRQRYLFIKENYPNITISTKNFVRKCLSFYLHLENDNKQSCKQDIIDVWKNDRACLNFKLKAACFIFKNFRPLYCLICKTYVLLLK